MLFLSSKTTELSLSQLSTFNSLPFITVQALWVRQTPPSDINALSYLLDRKLKEPKTFNYSGCASMRRGPI